MGGFILNDAFFLLPLFNFLFFHDYFWNECKYVGKWINDVLISEMEKKIVFLLEFSENFTYEKWLKEIREIEIGWGWGSRQEAFWFYQVFLMFSFKWENQQDDWYLHRFTIQHPSINMMSVLFVWMCSVGCDKKLPSFAKIKDYLSMAI